MTAWYYRGWYVCLTSRRRRFDPCRSSTFASSLFPIHTYIRCTRAHTVRAITLPYYYVGASVRLAVQVAVSFDRARVRRLFRNVLFRVLRGVLPRPTPSTAPPTRPRGRTAPRARVPKLPVEILLPTRAGQSHARQSPAAGQEGPRATAAAAAAAAAAEEAAARRRSSNNNNNNRVSWSTTTGRMCSRDLGRVGVGGARRRPTRPPPNRDNKIPAARAEKYSILSTLCRWGYGDILMRFL